MYKQPWTRGVAAGLALMWAACAAAQQPAAANLDRVAVTGRKVELSAWSRGESQHFVVYSDTREEDVTQLLTNLEKLDHLLRLYTQPVRQSEPPAGKLTLYYYSRSSDLAAVNDAAPADAVGLYSSCPSGVQGHGLHVERVVSLSESQLEKAPLADTLSHVFEAYTRHFLYRYTDIRAPASFIDGFAQYFSSVRFSEQHMVVGRTPVAVGGYLRFLNAGRRYSLEYEDVLEGRLANARSYGGAAGVRLEFETKSWLLTHYMLSSDDRRKRLSRYLGLVGEGASPTAAFERAFGMKTADLGSVLWRYGLRGVETLRVAVPTLPAASVSLRTLPRAAGEFVLVDAALKACPGRAAGESLLKRVIALDARFPGDPLGRLALSRARIEWGDPQQALPTLDGLLQRDEGHFEARYLAGMAHLRLAGRSDGEARRDHLLAAQRHLQRARVLNPQAPEAALALFRADVAVAETPDGAALQGVITAWQTARDVEALGRSAALAYAYAGQADEAYKTLVSLAQDPRDASMTRWASQWRMRLEAGVTRADILAEMRSGAASDASSREWTIDKAQVLQKVQLGDGLAAADAFIRQQRQESNAAGQSNGAPGGADRR